MSFSFSLFPLFLLPIFAAGLWLAYGLYLHRGAEDIVPRRWRWPLALLTLAAWLILAGLLVQPLWNSAKAIYHVPVIVLAVDKSASYDAGATLGAKEEVMRESEATKAFYRERGFRVLELVFGETTHPAGSREGVGPLTSLASLYRYLDSLATPNLQGIFLWTDGRFNVDTEASFEGWPAPVFPILSQGAGWKEVQGERVIAELSDSGIEVSVAWRNYGMEGTSLELQSGGRTFRRENLPKSDSGFGEMQMRRLHLPPLSRATAGIHTAETWTALIRPERLSDNATENNDTLEVQFSGLHRRRQIFLRPLRSLEERGMVDALFASDSMEALAVAPESLEAQLHSGDVLWARASDATRVLTVAGKMGIPVILYELPTETTASRGSFSGIARVGWPDAARRFLPAGVLSLGDLGVSDLALPPVYSAPDSGAALRPLLWVEEGGRRGLLLGRRKNNGAPVFEFSVLPFWNSQFRSDAEDRIRHLQEQWLQHIAEWVRLQGERVQVEVPTPLFAGRPIFLTARLFAPVDAAGASATRWELREKALKPEKFSKENIQALDSKESEVRMAPLYLTAGGHFLALYLNGERVWSDTVTVRDAAAVESSRLGFNTEALSSLALESHGKLLREANNKFTGNLPDLPRGQIQETQSQSRALFPVGLLTLILIFLLSLVWALRKKLHLD